MPYSGYQYSGVRSHDKEREEGESFSDSDVLYKTRASNLINHRTVSSASDMKKNKQIELHSKGVASSLPYNLGSNLFRRHPNDFTDDMEDFEDIHKDIKEIRSGRQRKKQAVRAFKGSEFHLTVRRKRRVYFCCLSNEIDIQSIYEAIINKTILVNEGWKSKLYNDVLHLYRSSAMSSDGPSVSDQSSQDWKISLPTSQEIFIFDFGSCVFWSFKKGEDAAYVNLFRKHITKGLIGVEEFSSGEDDMAFYTHDGDDLNPDLNIISIANEVFSLPENISPKQRLSISFAIAQSSVLSIFESRIQKLVEEYKHIPEDMAANGKSNLSERQLGTMIGEVFVIRHDVNLHSEILDTPDFFWKQEDIEKDYKMVSFCKIIYFPCYINEI